MVGPIVSDTRLPAVFTGSLARVLDGPIDGERITA
jgi:hypothetical protein